MCLQCTNFLFLSSFRAIYFSTSWFSTSCFSYCHAEAQSIRFARVVCFLKSYFTIIFFLVFFTKRKSSFLLFTLMPRPLDSCISYVCVYICVICSILSFYSSFLRSFISHSFIRVCILIQYYWTQWMMATLTGYTFIFLFPTSLLFTFGVCVFLWIINISFYFFSSPCIFLCTIFFIRWLLWLVWAKRVNWSIYDRFTNHIIAQRLVLQLAIFDVYYVASKLNADEKKNHTI